MEFSLSPYDYGVLGLMLIVFLVIVRLLINQLSQIISQLVSNDRAGEKETNELHVTSQNTVGSMVTLFQTVVIENTAAVRRIADQQSAGHSTTHLKVDEVQKAVATGFEGVHKAIGERDTVLNEIKSNAISSAAALQRLTQFLDNVSPGLDGIRPVIDNIAAQNNSILERIHILEKVDVPAIASAADIALA